MASPKNNSFVKIRSYKHNGRFHREWKENYILKTAHSHIICANDQVLVTEDDGRTWLTREPAIVYFHADHWFNIIGMLRADGIHYYCNLSSPFLYEGGAIKYIDYDLDIRVFPNMTYVLLDEDEYELHKVKMNYPPVIDRILTDNVNSLLSWIHDRKGPFAPEFVDYWYEQYLVYR